MDNQPVATKRKGHLNVSKAKKKRGEDESVEIFYAPELMFSNEEPSRTETASDNVKNGDFSSSEKNHTNNSEKTTVLHPQNQEQHNLVTIIPPAHVTNEFGRSQLPYAITSDQEYPINQIQSPTQYFMIPAISEPPTFETQQFQQTIIHARQHFGFPLSSGNRVPCRGITINNPELVEFVFTRAIGGKYFYHKGDIIGKLQGNNLVCWGEWKCMDRKETDHFCGQCSNLEFIIKHRYYDSRRTKHRIPPPLTEELRMYVEELKRVRKTETSHTSPASEAPNASQTTQKPKKKKDSPKT